MLHSTLPIGVVACGRRYVLYGRWSMPPPPLSGRKCRLEWAQMQGRVGANAASSGRKCRVEWAQMSARPGANLLSNGPKSPVERALMFGRPGAEGRQRGIAWPGFGRPMRYRELLAAGRTFVPSRARILAHSSKRSCPLNANIHGRSTGDICAHSSEHSCPLNATFLTGRPDICAHSSLHLRPVERDQ
jgi:hypothetical protein